MDQPMELLPISQQGLIPIGTSLIKILFIYFLFGINKYYLKIHLNALGTECFTCSTKKLPLTWMLVKWDVA